MRGPSRNLRGRMEKPWLSAGMALDQQVGQKTHGCLSGARGDGEAGSRDFWIIDRRDTNTIANESHRS